MPRPNAVSARSGRAQGGVIPRQPTRPLHLHPGYLLLAFLGGTAGTAARAGVGLAIPGGAVPYATLTVNIVGAFVLAALLTTLARRAPGGGHRARILFGTGAMGGFTTYSAFATDLVGLLDRGSVGAAIGYGLATVLVGGVASWTGISAATALHDRLRSAGATGFRAARNEYDDPATASPAGARQARRQVLDFGGDRHEYDDPVAAPLSLPRGSVAPPGRGPLSDVGEEPA